MTCVKNNMPLCISYNTTNSALQWSCEGRLSETCILNSPIRHGSVNLFSLRPTSVKSPEKSGVRESEEENEVVVTVDAVEVNEVENEKVESEVKLQEV